LNKIEFIQINITTSSKEEAQKLSKLLLSQKLAACFQIIGPMTSNYWWEDKIESDEEWLCQIKTLKINFNQIEQVIIENHSYDVPEIIVFPITNGSKNYLDWVKGICE
jgi:periplasmic divalent cation tolerance protein